ncbi:hypothetical protein AC1031_016809 [Aphanomyces cochlioides]|nr:hypothetical protein AC1031_016809 [Aphanomyces cochlioides]
MDIRRLFDSNEPALEASPSPVAQTTDVTESDMALIPTGFNIINSPEQRDDEKRIRPKILLALPAPEPDLSDEFMDPRSSSEDLNYSDEPDSAHSATSIGLDEMFMETVNQESPSTTNFNDELALYLTETSVGQQISTCIVETTKTITTRSIVTPSFLHHSLYPALPSSSPPSLEAVSTATTVTLPWTQP